MPERPWQSVSADFFGPTPGGWYWFVNICDHSNWASVEKIRATSEEQVEPVLDRLFGTFGAPEVYKTDNGSPFQSHHFKAFAEKWGFRHRRVTPEWPRANGKAESFMKKLGKVLKTAKISGMDEQEALLEFLRRYRETPHSTTGVSPNHLLLGFSRSSGIPSMLPETPEQREVWRKTALANDARAKKRMEADYNVRMRVREPVITVGSRVLVKLSKHRKNTSAWDVVNPYTVTEVSGSMVTARRDDGRTLTRNSSTFKLYRHAEIDESEPEASNPSVTSNSERREEASPAVFEPSTDANAQQAQDEQPVASPQPDTNAQLVTSQEQAVDVQPGTATKRGPGRPLLEESAKIQEERKAAQEAKRAANPPSRKSQRVSEKQGTR
jgi:hypothetical protein